MFGTLSIIGIAAAVLAPAGHYLLFGPKHKECASETRHVRRMSVLERLIHVLTLISFLTLAATGFVAAICWGRLHGWGMLIHLIVAPIFAIGVTACALRWAEASCFAPCDWQWVKKFGGYLGDRGHVPADRFNAGQKMFFWSVLGLGLVVISSGLIRAFPALCPASQGCIYAAHRYSALLLVMAVLVHIYLGTVANPGTWRAMLSGYVSSNWAKHHHPLWWERLDKDNVPEASAAYEAPDEAASADTDTE